MTSTFNLTTRRWSRRSGSRAQPDTVPAYQSVRFFLGKIDYQVAQGHRADARA